MQISDAWIRKVFTGRGDVTVEVELTVEDSVTGDVLVTRAAAPAGASRGAHEVLYFPEGGVDAALAAFEKLVAPEIVGLDVTEPYSTDGKLEEVDGTQRFEKIGGAVAIATSFAAAEAGAASLGVPLYSFIGGAYARRLPLPLGNVIGGGKHSRGLGPDIQEFLAMPLNPPDIYTAVYTNVEIHKRVLKYILKVDTSFTGGKNDEGAWTPRISSTTALKILREAAREVSGELGVEVGIGVDVAASSLWNGEKYVYKNEGVERDPREQFEFIAKLIEEYDLVYVEDPFHEEDFQSFAELRDRFKDRLIVGDDLFVTNPERIKKGGKIGAATGVIIKPDQIGTLLRAHQAVSAAREFGMRVIVSHRSGDTEYKTLAHIAVGFGAEVIKTGIMGGERTAKLNELIRIGDYLGKWATITQIRIH
ncbi:phosphopyruvate hydratase [Pyrobaculum aerophilum]|uniref:Enolase n=2 Tax=Pyrobaculum aerophilum TaxID=13773 RepID=ENO_PYRAE|nr:MULTISPECIES: enolase [Pyrobaculum]Q8ZYE7.1 RecName: Full=Enolase; AltName: Full=2-phospho-D-glycerate hydro-lyase; AltName: Full=2-phosphoglycerate dehydratase [Pyrobaculum aerophilum str. IM2]AAL63046.1 enolase [Pyrobaculum aerophilum str. IM2]MCX8136242.1 enolase [Pyrobaculum aerophilum]HII48183.1 enolase [Pyrobaculum aerophilum]